LSAGVKKGKLSKRAKVCNGKSGLFNMWDSNCDGKMTIRELKDGL